VKAQLQVATSAAGYEQLLSWAGPTGSISAHARDVVDLGKGCADVAGQRVGAVTRVGPRFQGGRLGEALNWEFAASSWRSCALKRAAWSSV
jgi:hypothetical protein